MDFITYKTTYFEKALRNMQLIRTIDPIKPDATKTSLNLRKHVSFLKRIESVITISGMNATKGITLVRNIGHMKHIKSIRTVNNVEALCTIQPLTTMNSFGYLKGMNCVSTNKTLKLHQPVTTTKLVKPTVDMRPVNYMNKTEL